MNKICVRCKCPKDISEFNKSGRSADGLHGWCRDCQKAKYQSEREVVCRRSTERKNILHKQIKALKIERKSVPCMDCGGSYPAFVMDFDHRGDKLFNIGSATTLNKSIKQVLVEIEKCDVVCANCHRIRTHAPVTPLASNESKV